MNQKEIAAIRQNAPADVIAQLGDMAVADVKALLKQEQDDKEPRQELVGSIQAYLVERLEAENAQATQRAEAAEKEAADAKTASEAATKEASDAKGRAQEAEKGLKEALASPEPSAKEVRGAEIKAHLKPDYTGSINVTQALERNAHLKDEKRK